MIKLLKVSIRKILFIFLFLFLLTLFFRLYSNYSCQRELDKVAERFTSLPHTGNFEETKPDSFFGHKKAPRAVLFLHSYQGAPLQYQEIFTELKKRNIPYYAPLLLGHGLSDYHLFTKVRGIDWMRESLEAYDLLASYAEKIDVVGFSNGGALAVFIANNRSINHLILLAPNLFPAPCQITSKKLLKNPLLERFFSWTIPTVSARLADRWIGTNKLKSKSPAKEEKPFYYPAFGAKSLKALWHVQDSVSLKKDEIQAEKIALLYGLHDERIDMETILQNTAHLGPALYPFETNHGLLLNREKERVVQKVVDLLSE